MSKKREVCFGDLTEITDFPETIYTIMHKISHLAYIGLQQNKQVVTSTDVKKLCPEIFELSNGYGLLQGVKQYPLRKGAAGHTISCILPYKNIWIPILCPLFHERNR